ncbi:MAG: biotin--[acetyl-CoA-carboxylase] ligase, partial [bacterium]
MKIYGSARILPLHNPLGDAPVVYLPVVSSTMDVVRDPSLLAELHLPARTSSQHGFVVAAGRQQTGRGTHGREWSADSGEAVLMTVVLERPAEWPFAAVRFGLAVRAYARSRGVDALVKWPNDVLVGEAKLAGVLCEWRGGVLLCGIGVNVFASPRGYAAVSLREAGAQGLGSYDNELSELLSCIAVYVNEDAERVREEFAACMYGKGARFRFRTPDAN